MDLAPFIASPLSQLRPGASDVRDSCSLLQPTCMSLQQLLAPKSSWTSLHQPSTAGTEGTKSVRVEQPLHLQHRSSVVAGSEAPMASVTTGDALLAVIGNSSLSNTPTDVRMFQFPRSSSEEGVIPDETSGRAQNVPEQPLPSPSSLSGSQRRSASIPIAPALQYQQMLESQREYEEEQMVEYRDTRMYQRIVSSRRAQDHSNPSSPATIGAAREGTFLSADSDANSPGGLGFHSSAVSATENELSSRSSSYSRGPPSPAFPGNVLFEDMPTAASSKIKDSYDGSEPEFVSLARWLDIKRQGTSAFATVPLSVHPRFRYDNVSPLTTSLERTSSVEAVPAITAAYKVFHATKQRSCSEGFHSDDTYGTDADQYDIGQLDNQDEHEFMFDLEL
jgi:hypothetical protein